MASRGLKKIKRQIKYLTPLPFDHVDHHDRNNHSQVKLIGRKRVFSHPNEKKNNQPKLENKTTEEEKNREGRWQERRYQDVDSGDKLEEREDGLKFPRSPSFKDLYCNSENGSRIEREKKE